MTLIELMVAMVLSLLVVLVAGAALLVSRQGFSNVDAASQLRDNGRFVQDLVQRLGVQTGFKSLAFATTPRPVSTEGVEANPIPNLFGMDNASRGASAAWNEGVAREGGTVGYGSDILVLRYQASVNSASSTASDGTMIDCMGQAAETAPVRRDDRLVSILHVGISSDGEPALMCSRSDNGNAPYETQPLIKGVESFQVLYGVDGVNPGDNAAPPGPADSVPERYLRASQLTVAGNNAATYANWERVRSLRIGLVLRGPRGSAVDRNPRTFLPLGDAPGSAFSSAADPGSSFEAGADGRLRQVVTFTVHLRNAQEDL